jgi:hypothetical protein
MPQTCTICKHPQRQPIEEAILSRGSFWRIAKRFGTSATSLFRHRNACLAHSLTKALDASEVLRGDSLVDHVKGLRVRTERLYGEAEAILDQAKKAKDLRTALTAIRDLGGLVRAMRGNAELLGQLTGELNPAPAMGVALYIAMPVPHVGTTLPSA